MITNLHRNIPGNTSVSLNDTIRNIYNEMKFNSNLEGQPTDLIPSLRKVKTDYFGVAINVDNHDLYSIGDSGNPFSIQSISKVFSLSVALTLVGEQLWNRVKMEPSSSAFNSIVQLEYENGIPRNPFINAGALVVCDILLSASKNPIYEVLQFIREISNDQKINYNPIVADEEKSLSLKNRALAYFMKSYSNLTNDVEKVIDLYCNICAIEMTCEQLAQAFSFYAIPKNNHLNKLGITRNSINRINALLQTCGFYNESGEITYRIGLPGKSGIGGGIVAIQPNYYSIAIWNPKLNNKGNSVYGIKFLEMLKNQLDKEGMFI